MACVCMCSTLVECVVVVVVVVVDVVVPTVLMSVTHGAARNSPQSKASIDYYGQEFVRWRLSMRVDFNVVSGRAFDGTVTGAEVVSPSMRGFVSANAGTDQAEVVVNNLRASVGLAPVKLSV